MAGFTIEFPSRPCYVKNQDGTIRGKALFHRWEQYSKVIPPSPMIGGHQGGVNSYVMGIVEFEDGTVDTIFPEFIRFADGGDFDEYIWE